MKVLFLSYPFPPSRAVGAVRAWNVARELTRRGVRVQVVTPDPALLADPDTSFDGDRLCREAGIERVLTGHRLRFLQGRWLRQRLGDGHDLASRAARRVAEAAGVEPTIGWFGAALRAARAARRPRADLLLATAPPFSTFLLARLLAREWRIPYVLDYRDPWSLAPHRVSSSARVRWLERRLLAHAAGVQVVSRTMAEDIRREFPEGPRPVLIPNGFDEEEVSRVRPAAFTHPAIVYTGTFYPEKRVITPVVRALAQANAVAPVPVYLHYYGSQGDHVAGRAREANASQWVVLHGRVSREDALAAVKGARAAVVITSVMNPGVREDRGIVTGKVFEAIGLGTRVLLVAPPGSDAADILRQVGEGAHFVGSDIEGIASWLARLGEYVDPAPDEGRREFGWKGIGERQVRYLLELVQRGDR